jgi:hypothetical protein
MRPNNRQLLTDPVTSVRQLLAVVHEAGTRLAVPNAQAINECRDRLDEAAELLQNLGIAMPGGDRKRDAALRSLLKALRVEVNHVAILLDSAAAFHAGWMYRAASMVAGYTAGGSPALPEAGRRLWLEA